MEWARLVAGTGRGSPALPSLGKAGRTVSGEPGKRVCASVWGNQSLAMLGQGGERREEGRKGREKGRERGQKGRERGAKGRGFPSPTQRQISFVAGFTTGSLSICLNANIRNILFGCS